MDKNKVRYGLNKLYWAKIIKYDDTTGLPIYGNPVRLPGAVSISLDTVGEASNFYADNCVYYTLNNNSGYEGDLEVAMIPDDFLIEILGDVRDSGGSLVEVNTATLSEFALLFEFDGDKNHIRHCFYKCTASRSAIEGSTTEEDKEVQTEKLSLSIGALDTGVVKRKSTTTTDIGDYKTWYDAVVIPTISVVDDDEQFTITHSPATTTFTDTVEVTLSSSIYDHTSGYPNGTIQYRLNYAGNYIDLAKGEKITLTETTTIDAHVLVRTQTGSFAVNPHVVTYTKKS